MPSRPTTTASTTSTPAAAAVPWLLTIAAGREMLRPSPASTRLGSAVADALEALAPNLPEVALGEGLDAWRVGQREMLRALEAEAGGPVNLGPAGAWWVMFLAARERLRECGGGFPRVVAALGALDEEFEQELRASSRWQVTTEALVAWCALQPGEGMYVTDEEARAAMLRSLAQSRPAGRAGRGGVLMRDVLGGPLLVVTEPHVAGARALVVDAVAPSAARAPGTRTVRAR